jgi:hypothetical protein
MIILTTYWGNRKEYAGLLADWVEAYIESGTTFPFSVLTDLETPNTHFPTTRVDVSNHQILMRPNHPMDRKGALMLEALRLIDGPVLVIDTDATLNQPLQNFVGPWEMSRIAITRDSGPRTIDVGYGEPIFKEMCAGVMYFGQGDKGQIIDNYHRAFGQLCIKTPLEPLLEQWAWSVVWKRMQGDMLPDTMGWVERRWGKNDKATILHDHGTGKFARYRNNSPSSPSRLTGHR